jgi:hypothetical protein
MRAEAAVLPNAEYEYEELDPRFVPVEFSAAAFRNYAIVTRRRGSTYTPSTGYRITSGARMFIFQLGRSPGTLDGGARWEVRHVR